jgi:ribose 5-phosphate isomerase A
MAPTSNVDYAAERMRVAQRSLDFIEPDMLLGVGSGTTVAALVDLLGQRVAAGLRVRVVCGSTHIKAQAAAAGIPLIDDAGFRRLDLTIDGADELDAQLRAIKGGGAALLHEKIIAAAADRVIFIGDSRKPVAQLGQAPVPVEIVPFGWPSVARRLAALGPTPVLRLDPATGGPVVTDEGNYIVDCRFGAIAEPEALAERLAAIPGVMAHGLFLGLASMALIARGDSVEVLTAQASVAP